MRKARGTSKGRTPLSGNDYELLASFRQRLREFLHFSENAARSAGVHPQQHQALLAIRGSPGRSFLTVGEIASSLKIRHNSAVELVNRMESEGLVLKVADADDGRRVQIHLTRSSERVLKRLSVAHKAELARVGPALKEILTNLKIAS
jgi:DNA-binding MarR family transcriptional regulator